MKSRFILHCIQLIAVITGMGACVKTTGTKEENKFVSLNVSHTASGYLRKTQALYFYSAPGSPTIQSTSTTKWAYDAENRVISQILIDTSDGADVYDTTTYTYSTKKNITTSKGINTIPTTRVDYFNSGGLMDSTVVTQVELRGGTTTDVFAYKYDANGNDTVTIEYSRGSNISVLLQTTRNTFVNNSLSTSAEYDNLGVILSFSNYSGGNNTSVLTYQNGAYVGTVTNNYSSILSGGFYGYTGNNNLQVTSQSSIPVASGGFDYNYMYTFDSSNRVSTMVNKNSAGLTTEKGVYTYY